MKILIITSIYPKNGSIQGVFVQEQARALSAKHQITVAHVFVDYEKFDPFFKSSISLEMDGAVNVYALRVSRSFPVYNQINFIYTAYSVLKNKLLPSAGFDCIHCHFSYPSGVIAAFLKRNFKFPILITEHSRLTAAYKTLFHKILSKYALRKSDEIIAVSSPLKYEIEAYVNRQVRVIYNHVDLSRFKIQKKKNNSKVDIGFLGGLYNDTKGLDLLLNAVSKLDFSNWILHVGGDGPLLKHYKEMAQKLGIETKCLFLGQINPENISYFYSNLDFFVVASRYETFGIVLIEAMASGLPVLATRCGGPESIVTPQVGLLIDKDNIDELNSGIKKIISMLNAFQAESIREYVSANFSSEILTEKLTELYLQSRIKAFS